MTKLTNKQEAFCQQYVIDKNATQAAIRAGYSEKTAGQIGDENLKKPAIKKRLKELNESLLNQYNELCQIQLNKKVMEKLFSLFKTPREINKWAEDKLIAAAIAEGLELRRSRNITEGNRYDVMFDAGFKCQCCGESPKPDNDVVLHIDHIIPFSLGGTNHISNLQCLCGLCNLSKSNRYSINHKELINE